MEEEEKKNVQYYSKDFEWKTLEDKYKTYFQSLSTNQNGNTCVLQDYEKKWEDFYQINQENFFKDRKYLLKSFEEIETLCAKNPNQKLYLMEAGCGVGNTIFPLLKQVKTGNLFIFGFDISETAIKLTKKNELYDEKRVKTFVCNILNEEVSTLLSEKLDFCTMIFFLSSFLKKDLETVVQKIDKVMKQGGIIFIRDYGLYDLAMLRNEKKGNLIENNSFQKGDGIVVQYFSKELISELFQKFGYEEIENDYCTIERENKKRSLNLSRVFINSKFRKK